MVLEGLSVNVKDELAHFLVEINSGFDSTNLVVEGCRKLSSGIAEGNTCLVKVGLV